MRRTRAIARTLLSDEENITLLDSAQILVMHLACLALPFVGISAVAVATCLATYLLCVFALAISTSL